MEQQQDSKHLVYIADPMCSWCYGFAPVIEAITDQFRYRLPTFLVMGGLRAGNTKAMSVADRESIRGHWQRVQATTGQPFDYGFFDRQDFVYDTEPACRAVVTMRLLNPDIALAFFHRVQNAFYSEGRDTTDDATLGDIAAECGVDRAAFLLEMCSEEARASTQADFLLAQRAGVTGFPTLLAGPGPDGYGVVTHGYSALGTIPDALEAWLAGAITQH